MKTSNSSAKLLLKHLLQQVEVESAQLLLLELAEYPGSHVGLLPTLRSANPNFNISDFWGKLTELLNNAFEALVPSVGAHFAHFHRSAARLQVVAQHYHVPRLYVVFLRQSFQLHSSLVHENSALYQQKTVFLPPLLPKPTDEELADIVPLMLVEEGRVADTVEQEATRGGPGGESSDGVLEEEVEGESGKGLQQHINEVIQTAINKS